MHTSMMPRPVQAALMGFGAGLAAALAIGVPTAVIPNLIFVRMTPVRDFDWAYLALSVVLAAALGATYAFPRFCARPQRELTAGGMLTFFAVGCPVCNKLVVLLLGLSGAMRWFAPVQPFLGASGVLLLMVALIVRLRVIRPVASRVAHAA